MLSQFSVKTFLLQIVNCDNLFIHRQYDLLTPIFAVALYTVSTQNFLHDNLYLFLFVFLFLIIFVQ